MKKLFCMLVTTLTVAGSSAQESAPKPEQDMGTTAQAVHAMHLFEEGCFRNLGSLARVATWAKLAVLIEIPKEDAKNFLNNGPGSAWQASNSLGSFAISVTEDGVCSVFARKAAASSLKELYRAFLPKPEVGMTLEKRKEETVKTDGVERYTLGYDIGRADAAVRISTLLTTSESAQAPMQGILSLQLVRRPGS